MYQAGHRAPADPQLVVARKPDADEAGYGLHRQPSARATPVGPSQLLSREAFDHEGPPMRLIANTPRATSAATHAPPNAIDTRALV